jgi:hypothetical protein
MPSRSSATLREDGKHVELNQHAQDVLGEPALGNASVSDSVDANADPASAFAGGRVTMNGPMLVPLLVNRSTTLSPLAMTSSISRCISLQALVSLAVKAALNAAFPSKAPRLPPCQISSSDHVSLIAAGSRPSTAPSMKRGTTATFSSPWERAGR